MRSDAVSPKQEGVPVIKLSPCMAEANMILPDLYGDKEFLLKVKQKLKVAGLYLMGGEVSFDFVFDGVSDEYHGTSYFCDLERFFLGKESPLRGDWDYYHFQSGSGDFSELGYFLPQVDEFLVWIMAGVFLWVPYEGYNLRSGKEIRKAVNEVISTNFEDLEPEDHRSLLSRGVEFVKDLIRLKRGKPTKGDDLSAFLSDLNDLFGGVFNSRFLVENISLFSATLFEGNYDYGYRTAAISSQEVFLYHRYREAVPEKHRVAADTCIRILDDPLHGEGDINGSPIVVSGDIEESRCHVVLIQTCEYSPDQTLTMYEDSNPFYREAVLWLDRNLPDLRKRYGGKYGADTPVSSVK